MLYSLFHYVEGMNLNARRLASKRFGLCIDGATFAYYDGRAGLLRVSIIYSALFGFFQKVSSGHYRYLLLFSHSIHCFKGTFWKIRL